MMGMIEIRTMGSFPNDIRTFGAMKNGHAHAVAQAITYLSHVVLPEAIERDHKLHEQGEQPRKGFNRPGAVYDA